MEGATAEAYPEVDRTECSEDHHREPKGILRSKVDRMVRWAGPTADLATSGGEEEAATIPNLHEDRQGTVGGA